MEKKHNNAKHTWFRAQGTVEYMLLVGGAVLVAVIVIVLVLNIQSAGEAGVMWRCL